MSLSSSRRPVRAAVAVATSLSLTVAGVPTVANAGAPAQPRSVAITSPDDMVRVLESAWTGSDNPANLLRQEFDINGVKVTGAAALAGALGTLAALGAVSAVVINAIVNAVTGNTGKGLSSGSGSSEPLKSTPATGEQTHPQAEYLNRFDFTPVRPDQAMGGFSGIDQMKPGEYVVISDDKNEHGPIRAYRFASSDLRTFTPAGELHFTQPDGSPYTDYIDAEEIRVLPDGNLLWTTEGKAKRGDVVPPQIIQSTPDGKEIRRINTPAYHVPDGREKRGIYDNNGPEAMALLSDGRTIVTVEENALAQDGRKNDDKHSSLNRVTFYDLESGTPTKEYVARVNAGRGAVSLLADEKDNLYLLERGFFKNLGVGGENKAEIYKLDVTGADDVLGEETLAGSERTVSKQLVFDFSTVKPHPDNVEGIAWGPRDADGRRPLVAVTDDNFSDKQATLFHTLLLP
ncbi:esterase-like activity of phytase family protein [Corynebacterium sp. p3-SID1145]|uniref:esterase-like activity of phytase family protein n=1 Tax=unclassified Corynebacterium TaxID=2624378 RepID=UPI0021AA7002|nr:MULTISPECIES: esterase-like activity of phytase family protein [unclassified Corynebacterium]MCT1451941.1 esterase-like activity of phytase family protein [Corynebacterium sp. p3-SID1145]MCT1461084.1 esterase-like activity of phytase family protein [Corynebacterium sp. p3-SID1140]